MTPSQLILAVAGLGLGLAWVGTGVVRWYALRTQLLDVPNERSSHKVPTPRGGGLGVVVAHLAAVLALAILGHVPWPAAATLAGGGILVALIGWLDDRYHLRASLRLLVHLAACTAAVLALKGIPAFPAGPWMLAWGWLGAAIIILAMVWMVNLFNFMDGIDGIAGGTAALGAGVGAAIALWLGDGTTFALSLTLAGAAIGFLGWNWPPARIFMGDVGSGYLGYALAVCALNAMSHGPASVWAWVILMGAFIVDTTITLVRRAQRGQKVWLPHRSHAYQHLTTRAGSHLVVTLGVLAILAFWQAPWAVAVIVWPHYAPAFVVVSLAPLAALAWRAGAGLEKPTPKCEPTA